MAKIAGTPSEDNEHDGVWSDAHRWRRLTAGRCSVQVRNDYPKEANKTIEGRCTFFFKDRDLGKLIDKPESVDAAAVPSCDVLLFQPTDTGCVSAFRVRLVIRRGTKVVDRKLIERADRQRQCWSAARFTCGDE
jgi:hypothetical protein